MKNIIRKILGIDVYKYQIDALRSTCRHLEQELKRQDGKIDSVSSELSSTKHVLGNNIDKIKSR